MKRQNLFYNDNQQIKSIWRILIFILLLFTAVLPLFLINNKIIQFFGATLILIFGLYLNSKYLDKRKFSEYGIVFKKDTFKHLIVGLIIGFFSVVLMLLIGESTGILSVSESKAIFDASLIYLFACKMLLVSILEETFFRGYLFTNLCDAFKTKNISNKQAILFALILSSTLFGLAHFSNNNTSILSLIALTINGVVWCIPLILTKNLGLSIGMHAAWNFTQTQLGFTMSGNKALHSCYSIENVGSDLFTGGDYGPESGILGLIGFSIMLSMSLLYLRNSFMKNRKLLSCVFLTLLICVAFSSCNKKEITFKNLDFNTTCASFDSLCDWKSSYAVRSKFSFINKSNTETDFSLQIDNSDNGVGYLEQAYRTVNSSEEIIFKFSTQIKTEDLQGKGAGLTVGIYDDKNTMIQNVDMGTPILTM